MMNDDDRKKYSGCSKNITLTRPGKHGCDAMADQIMQLSKMRLYDGKARQNCVMLLMFIWSIPASQAEDQASNCDEHEVILFSCSTGKKVVSFCASPKGSKPAYLEYRFGTPEKIELRYKVEEQNPNTKISRADVLGASGASTEIWFEKMVSTTFLVIRSKEAQHWKSSNKKNWLLD